MASLRSTIGSVGASTFIRRQADKGFKFVENTPEERAAAKDRMLRSPALSRLSGGRLPGVDQMLGVVGRFEPMSDAERADYDPDAFKKREKALSSGRAILVPGTKTLGGSTSNL